jgi:Signal transduction histidine kinase regulating C4-dicarboxylate transport system
MKISIFRSFISIRTKLLISLFVLITLFGGISIYLCYSYITNAAKTDLSKKATFIIHLMGDQVLDLIMIKDYASINVLVNHYMTNDPEILYILIYDKDKNIIGHSFENGDIPEFVLSSNVSDSVGLFQDKQRGLRIRQYTTSLSHGMMGYLRVGLDESIAFNKGKRMASFIAMLIAFLSIPAAMIAVSFSYFITYPVRRILNGLKQFMPGEALPKITILFNDEIKLLANGIQEMMQRISLMTEESKKTQLKIIETEKNASVGILASGIAHEINNPIAGIEICAYRLDRDKSLSVKDREYVQLIIEAARHIQSIVKNLLNYARQPDLQETSLDLRAAIGVAEKLVQFRLKKNNIRFEIACPQYPCIILGIKAQIIQVLVNGLLNAVDAVGQDGAITISLAERDGSYVLSIIDNGKGMTPEIKSKAFDPFFTTKGTRGTGLGLFVSYNIIKAHNGRIDLNSNSGKGACLEITLPKGDHI